MTNTAICYDKYRDWKKWSYEDFGKFSKVDHVYYSAELRRVVSHRNNLVDVFEVGFGNGSFASWAQEQGFNYSGSELDVELLERANKAGIKVFDATDAFSSFEEATLDLVVAFDVFEHLILEDLEAMLISIKRALRPGGCVLARVPSGDSPFGRAIFHGDITHQLALGSSAIKQIATRCGLNVAYIAPPCLPLLGVGFSTGIRRALVLSMQRIVSRLINLTFHGGQPFVITGSLIFLLENEEEAEV